MQLLERFVNVIELHAVCHEVFQRDLARHPLIDELGHTGGEERRRRRKEEEEK